MSFNKALFLGGLIVSVVGVVGHWLLIPTNPIMGTFFVMSFGIMATLNFIELMK